MCLTALTAACLPVRSSMATRSGQARGRVTARLWTLSFLPVKMRQSGFPVAPALLPTNGCLNLLGIFCPICSPETCIALDL
jgi:hypothetical protein